jgi:hypothetical protein
MIRADSISAVIESLLRLLLSIAPTSDCSSSPEVRLPHRPETPWSHDDIVADPEGNRPGAGFATEPMIEMRKGCRTPR